MDETKRQQVVRRSCPGAGACGGMYTANTMASAIEALGMSLPYSSSIPAEDPGKLDECFRAGAAIRRLLERDIKPRDIMTRPAFENAMVIVMALGGSTNAVLHLIAMARSIGVPLTIDDFAKVSDRVPYLADLKPSGKFVQEDLQGIGGTPAVMKYLLGERLSGRRLPDCHRSRPSSKIWPSFRASRRGRKSFVLLKNRSSRPATFASSAATWRPRAPSPRSPAKRGPVLRGRRSVYDSEEAHACRARKAGNQKGGCGRDSL